MKGDGGLEMWGVELTLLVPCMPGFYEILNLIGIRIRVDCNELLVLIQIGIRIGVDCDE